MWNKFYILAFYISILYLGHKSPLGANKFSKAVKSVVRIEVISFQYNYKSPWSQPAIRKSSGTGFIIKNKQILTNAHVVSGADSIRVSLAHHKTDYVAKVVHIANDCDLAVLEVEDAVFFEKSNKLEIGKNPVLNSPVEVIGYPIGGDHISITRGIVSRMGMDVYSHSQIDYHMTIQVDAAINPGNSGGPALQDGKVIGVAFQSLRSGENLGYLIPPVVINKFLKDIEDGRYDGYIELGVVHQTTVNAILKKALGIQKVIKSQDTGVYIYSIIPDSSSDGFLFPGDVLLKINGYGISENGDVDLAGSRQPFSLVIDNLESGEIITTQVLRNGIVKTIKMKARPTPAFDHMRKNYDKPPDYYIANGLLFQPLNANLMASYSASWKKYPEILYRYNYFISGKIYKEVDQDIILTMRLGDPVNTYSGRYVNSIVYKINGKIVKNFDEFLVLFDDALNRNRNVVIEFRGQDVPLILKKNDIVISKNRIRQKYGILNMKNHTKDDKE